MDLSFAMQTELLLATRYFQDAVSKIQIRYSGEILPFESLQYNPSGGKCYYLSGWAIMGLTSADHRICGTIDLPERPGFKAKKDYLHAWVRFEYHGNWYIYDPLEAIIYPEAIWEERHRPRKITFNMTQEEILDVVLKEDYAYQIGEYIWQFKDSKHMPEEWKNEENGYLYDVLAYGQLHYSYCTVSNFLAYRKNPF